MSLEELSHFIFLNQSTEKIQHISNDDWFKTKTNSSLFPLGTKTRSCQRQQAFAVPAAVSSTLWSPASTVETLQCLLEKFPVPLSGMTVPPSMYCSNLLDEKVAKSQHFMLAGGQEQIILNYQPKCIVVNMNGRKTCCILPITALRTHSFWLDLSHQIKKQQ